MEVTDVNQRENIKKQIHELNQSIKLQLKGNCPFFRKEPDVMQENIC